jgi:hypothetical protein
LYEYQSIEDPDKEYGDLRVYMGLQFGFNSVVLWWILQFVANMIAGWISTMQEKCDEKIP